MSLFVLRHSQEGQKILAKLLAAKYVRRGANWLTQYAPKGWFRNCLNNGISRIHSSYGNEGILGIAFEYCEEFADSSGYINEGKVLRHFGLPLYSRKTFELGFDTPFKGYKPFRKKYPEIVITNTLLDTAWGEFVRNPPGMWRLCYRHPTALDREFAKMDFLNLSRPTLLERFRNIFVLR